MRREIKDLKNKLYKLTIDYIGSQDIRDRRSLEYTIKNLIEVIKTMKG